jgi:ethanolamine ammonia-lyase large subunit
LSVHNIVSVVQKFVHIQDVEKGAEVRQGAALHMVGAEGATKRVAAKELRARPSFVRLMEAGGVASTLDAPRALKAVLASA